MKRANLRQINRVCEHCTPEGAEDEDEIVYYVQEPGADGDNFCPECAACPLPSMINDERNKQRQNERIRELREFLVEEKGERKKCVGGFLPGALKDL